jgi:O-antigen/teichoic acid export membrane protein
MSVLVGAVLDIARSFFTARWLGPSAFGTWQFLNIFAKYLPFASVGTWAGMERHIPHFRGRSDHQAVQLIVNTALIINLCGSILYAAVVFGWSFFVEHDYDANALAAYAPVVFLLIWLRYAKSFCISNALYGAGSRLELFTAVFTALFTVLFVYYWGLYGAIGGVGVATFIAVAIYIREHLRRVPLASTIQWQVVRNLVVTGLPLVGNGMLLTTMNTADKIMISAMLSREVLGTYSVAFAIVNILRAIPVAFGTMLFAKFSEMDGQNRSERHMSDVIEKTTITLSCSFAMVASLAIACFPIVTVYLLPQYVGGIPAGRLLVGSVAIQVVSGPLTNWSVVRGQIAHVMILRCLMIAAEFGAIYLAIRCGGSLGSIALCVIAAWLFYYVALAVDRAHLQHLPLVSSFFYAIGSLSSMLIIFAGILTQEYIYPINNYASGTQVISSCMLGLVFSVMVSVPFVYSLNKRTGIFKLVSEAI